MGNSLSAPAQTAADAVNALTPEERPSAPPAGVRSATVLSLNSAGWLMVACLFLPVCTSCGGTLVRPINALAQPVDFGNFVPFIIFSGVYGNGALVAVLVTLSALLRSREFWWRAFLAQWTISLVIAATVILQTLAAAHTARDYFQHIFVFVVPLVGYVAWVFVALRRGEHERAWARLQHLWTIGAWGQLHIFCIFQTELHYGYWVTLLAIGAQFLAVEVARHRMVHDLWDRRVEANRVRFSLQRIFLWMTVPALVFGYFQAVVPLVETFFGDD